MLTIYTRLVYILHTCIALGSVAWLIEIEWYRYCVGIRKTSRTNNI
jgi:hypothetical protein